MSASASVASHSASFDEVIQLVGVAWMSRMFKSAGSTEYRINEPAVNVIALSEESLTTMEPLQMSHCAVTSSLSVVKYSEAWLPEMKGSMSECCGPGSCTEVAFSSVLAKG